MSRIKRSASTGLPTVNFSDHGPVRYLHLGTDWVQGAMRLDDPYALDLEYIQRWSILLDLSIVLRTVRVVLSGRGV